MCFWPAKTRKNLELFEMHTCLWSSAQMWFRQRRRKLVTASPLLHCIDEYSCLRYWNEFFSGVFQVLHWSFLVLLSDGNVCNWIPKVIWQRMDWFWVFCWEMASFVDFLIVWTEVCKNRWIVALFWGHQIFSMFSSRGILVCSSKMIVFFRHMILWYRLTSWQALEKQCNFTFSLLLSSSLFFLEVVINVFDYFWKPNSLFSKFCVNCLLMLYFVYCNNYAL